MVQRGWQGLGPGLGTIYPSTIRSAEEFRADDRHFSPASRGRQRGGQKSQRQEPALASPPWSEAGSSLDTGFYAADDTLEPMAEAGGDEERQAAVGAAAREALSHRGRWRQEVDWGDIGDRLFIGLLLYLGGVAALVVAVYLLQDERAFTTRAEPSAVPRYQLSLHGPPGSLVPYGTEQEAPPPAEAPSTALEATAPNAEVNSETAEEASSTPPPVAAQEQVAGEPERSTQAQAAGSTAEASSGAAAAAGQSAEVAALLQQAEQSLRRLRLTTPADDSALFYFREVLKRDADNAAARAGFQRIANRYADLSRRQLREANYEKALRFAETGLKVVPDMPALMALERDARAQLLQSQQRALPSSSLDFSPRPAPAVGDAPAGSNAEPGFRSGFNSR